MRYRFSHRGSDGRYYWYSVQTIGPRESRYEQISCPVAWFWGREVVGSCSIYEMFEAYEEARGGAVSEQ